MLGTASIWGFESDDPYLDQAIEVYGLVDQALEEAKATVDIGVSA